MNRYPGRRGVAPKACWPLGVVGALVLSACGCGGGEPAKPMEAQAEVSGSVTNDGKPVPLDSTVVFFCKDKDVTAGGKVDSVGNYSLTAANPKVGIPAGRYHVSIRPPYVAAPPVGSEEYTKIMQNPAKATSGAAETSKDIPLKFQTFETSKIVLELKAGANKFDFDLAKL